MDSQKLVQVINAHYAEWTIYVRKVASNYQLDDEAQDILNDVLYNVLKRNKNEAIQLKSSCQQEENDIERYLIRAIKRAITLSSSHHRKHFQNITQRTNHPGDFSSFMLTDEEEIYTDNLEMIHQALEKLRLSEREQKIFKFYYFGNNLLKQWEGKESISTVCRKSQRICKKLKQQVEIDRKLKKNARTGGIIRSFVFCSFLISIFFSILSLWLGQPCTTLSLPQSPTKALPKCYQSAFESTLVAVWLNRGQCSI